MSVSAFNNLTPPEVRIKNDFFFTNLDEFNLSFTILKNGKVIREGPAVRLKLLPQEDTVMQIPFTPDAGTADEYFLDMRLALANDQPWARKGYTVAEAQFPVNTAAPVFRERETAKDPALKLQRGDQMITVSGKKFSIAFDPKEGKISSWLNDGTEMLKKGPELNFWRPPTENDYRDWHGYQAWKKSGLDSLDKVIGTTVVRPIRKNLIEIGFEVLYRYHGELRIQSYQQYLVHGNGEVTLTSWIRPSPAIQALAKVGMQMELRPGYEQVEWYGRGPMESYPDRQSCADAGLYQMPVDSLWENYIVPQENGNRSGVRWMTIVNSGGNGLLVTGDSLFNFSAYHYTDRNIEDAKHTVELEKKDFVTLNVDHLQQGLGTATCGPSTFPQYVLPVTGMKFTIRMKPFRSGMDAQESYSSRSPLIAVKFSPAPVMQGNRFFNGEDHVELSAEGATLIRYTLDGSIPGSDEPGVPLAGEDHRDHGIDRQIFFRGNQCPE